MKFHSAFGPLLILAGALCASTAGVAQALAPDGATPTAIGAVRLLGGGLSLFLFLLLTGRLPSPSGWPLPRILTAAAGLLVCQLSFFAATKSVGVAVGSVVTLGSSPIMVGLLGVLLLGERPSRLWYGATFLAVSGLLTLSLEGVGNLSFNMSGVLLAVLSGCAYSVFLVSVKPLLRDRDPLQIMAIVFLLGGAAMLPMLAMQPPSWVASAHGLLVVLVLGLLTTALAFILLLAGMRTTPVAVTATLGLADPLGAALFGVFLLGETLSGQALGGLAMILVGMLLLAARPAEAAA